MDSKSNIIMYHPLITFSLYMARCWAAVPSPRQPKWPLAWIWQVLRTSDETFLRLSGVDATVYTRFLRACCESLCFSCTFIHILQSISPPFTLARPLSSFCPFTIASDRLRSSGATSTGSPSPPSSAASMRSAPTRYYGSIWSWYVPALLLRVFSFFAGYLDHCFLVAASYLVRPWLASIPGLCRSPCLRSSINY